MDPLTCISQIRQQLAKSDALIFKAPGRINIIGEHTDYNQGLCMPAAIDRAIYLGIVPSGETEIISLDQNQHWFISQENKIPDWGIYFKGVLDLLKQQGYSWPYFKLAFGGNLPSGAGLSSSSAISCGFISILNEFAGLKLNKDVLTRFAVQAEKSSGLDGGMMDQICIMNGHKDHALIIDCSTWKFEYLKILIPDLSWLVVDTRVKHKLVNTDYNSRSTSCKEIYQLALELFPGIRSISQLDDPQKEHIKNQLSEPMRNYLDYILNENKRVKEMAVAIKETNLKKIGNILFQGHEGLRKQYQVSCDALDFLVNYAKNNESAFGARMMGGGFGGCTLHLVPVIEKHSYSKGIANAYKNRFGFESEIFEAIIDDGVKKIAG